MGIKEKFSKTQSFVKQAVGAAKQTSKVLKNGELLSYKHTYAAINLIKLKTENRIFAVSTFVSLIFLGFYGYLIYLNVADYSLRHIIIYSVLGVLLLVSLGFNIALNPMRKRKKTAKDKKKDKKIKDVEKNVVLVISTLTKLASLGFMLYDIITVDSSLKHLVPFGCSTLALIFQLLFAYITRLFTSYYDILLVGIESDIKDSGIIDIISETHFLNDPLNPANMDKNKKEKIKENLKVQVDINNDIKIRNKKSVLFDLAKYCFDNQRTIDDVINEFEMLPSIALGKLNELKKMGIIDNATDNPIKVIIDDINEIKKIIYSE